MNASNNERSLIIQTTGIAGNILKLLMRLTVCSCTLPERIYLIKIVEVVMEIINSSGDIKKSILLTP